MSRRIPITAVLAFAALAMPLAVTAQVTQPAPAPPELQNWIRELQEVDARIQPLKQQALQDEALRAEHEQLNVAIRKALIAANPAIEAQIDRLEKIAEEARAAQTAGDAEKSAALVKEAEALQPGIEKAKAQVLDQPEVSAQVTAFREKLNKRIVELDPEAKALIDRRHELDQQIKKARAGGN